MVHQRKSSRHNMDNDHCLSCFSGNSVCLQHVWQKLDLGPLTPPRSPDHDGSCESPILDDIINPYDEMEFFSDVLIPVKELFPEGPPSPNLHSGLIQDCMWSGNNGIENLEKKSSNTSVDYTSSQCVEPADVFPYPLAPAAHSIKDKYLTETRLHSLGTETPSDSEEEIDVVTVQQQQQQLNTVNYDLKSKTECVMGRTIKKEPIDSEFTSAKPTINTVTVKVKVDCPTDVHNYSLPHAHSLKRVRSVPLSPSNSPVSNKRLKRELSAPDFAKRVCQKLRTGTSSCGNSSASSSRSSSDSEECIGEGGKRTQHNVLERKRRNDLKYSFFHLRDSVPELNQQERAPKVQILRKAADYVHQLNSDSYRLEMEKEFQREKHDQLRKTLAKLQCRDF